MCPGPYMTATHTRKTKTQRLTLYSMCHHPPLDILFLSQIIVVVRGVRITTVALYISLAIFFPFLFQNGLER